jgi:hypothetical protein
MYCLRSLGELTIRTSRSAVVVELVHGDGTHLHHGASRWRMEKLEWISFVAVNHLTPCQIIAFVFVRSNLMVCSVALLVPSFRALKPRATSYWP